jgi:hypothetical protein
VSYCDQTEAGIESYHDCMGNLDALRVGYGGTMLGMGVVGTIIVILVIVWFVRRA